MILTEPIAVEVIKWKINGSTLYKAQNKASIDIETSDVVKTKMSNVFQKVKTATQHTNKIDSLRKVLEASYIDEGL